MKECLECKKWHKNESNFCSNECYKKHYENVIDMFEAKDMIEEKKALDRTKAIEEGVRKRAKELALNWTKPKDESQTNQLKSEILSFDNWFVPQSKNEEDE